MSAGSRALIGCPYAKLLGELGGDPGWHGNGWRTWMMYDGQQAGWQPAELTHTKTGDQISLVTVASFHDIHVDVIPLPLLLRFGLTTNHDEAGTHVTRQGWLLEPLHWRSVFPSSTSSRGPKFWGFLNHHVKAQYRRNRVSCNVAVRKRQQAVVCFPTGSFPEVDLIFSKQVHIQPKGWRRNYRAWDKCSSSPTGYLDQLAVEAAAVPNERGDLVLMPSTRPTVKAAIGLYLKIGFYQQRDVCGKKGSL
ncbi:hypothetical protein Bbelb_446850 [Branchiostoma belcheri]|nr:hypothetical protein Bbelb_446850 [Branchiostoma belcheri]